MSPPDEAETQLIERLVRRDERAFNELVRAHQGRVFGLVLRMLGNRAEAEDVTQEVFVQVFKAIGSFRGESKLSTTIGLIGAGHIGNQVARLAVANGYEVVISNSRGPRARAGTALDAAKAGDIVVVTVPLKNYRAIPVEPLAGKIVIDTNNYCPQRDGHIPEIDDESTTTSELLQRHLPTSKVVKGFNHIYAADLTTHGQPAGSKNRRALVIAGDDKEAKATVTHWLDQFGFDTVDAGPLSEGWRI